jgi:hypothetical protein
MKMNLYYIFYYIKYIIMASTRNKNTPGNFCLDHRQNVQIESWQLYKNGAGGYAYETNLAGRGFNQGHMPWNTLSHNPADIESFLFGINSTNLVNPAPPLRPELKCLQSANLYGKTDTLMPVPLVVPKNQRPFPVPQ